VVAAISTGVVGLAGIGGTLWQGKRSREAQTAGIKASLDATADNLKVGIDAENERARLAEKRRIYASYSATIFHAYAIATQKPGVAVKEKAETMLAAIEAISQLELIAPDAVTGLARDALLTITGSEEVDNAQFNTLRPLMSRAMRADLGEAVEDNT